MVDVADVGEEHLLVHDEHRADPGLAFMLSRLAPDTHSPTPVGVFRDVEGPEYATEVAGHLEVATGRLGTGDLAALLRSGATWEI